MQKLHNRTGGRYTDQQIHQAPHARVRSRDIARNGRPYRSQLKSLNS